MRLGNRDHIQHSLKFGLSEASIENQRLQDQLQQMERDKKGLEEKIKVLDNKMQRNNIE